MKVIYFFFLLLLIGSCKQKAPENINTVPDFRIDGTLWLLNAAESDTLQQLEIEIADDEFEIQTGLMYRPAMQENRGMLFVFKRPEPHAFYMKNTLIPLDIIFIDSNKQIVNIHKNAHPLDESSLPSEGPVQYVLEINGGLSERWGLKKGDKILWK